MEKQGKSEAPRRWRRLKKRSPESEEGSDPTWNPPSSEEEETSSSEHEERARTPSKFAQKIIARLREKGVSKSRSAPLSEFVKEWHFVPVDEYADGWKSDSVCDLCGYEHIRFRFVIMNHLNGHAVRPVGSTCIKTLAGAGLRTMLDDERSRTFINDYVNRVTDEGAKERAEIKKFIVA